MPLLEPGLDVFRSRQLFAEGDRLVRLPLPSQGLREQESGGRVLHRLVPWLRVPGRLSVSGADLRLHFAELLLRVGRASFHEVQNRVRKKSGDVGMLFAGDRMVLR